MDILRERAERADRLEIEVQKYREKLGDSDFYKSRVEELREDNRVLLESKYVYISKYFNFNSNYKLFTEKC